MCHVFPATTFVEAGGVGLSSLPPTCLTHPWRKSPTPTCGYTQQRRPALHVKNKSGEGESQSREKEEKEERFTSRNQDNFFPFSTLVFSLLSPASPPLRDFCLSSAEEEETYEKETGRRRLFALHSWLFFSGSRACLVLVYCALSSLCEIWSLSSAGLSPTSFLSRSESPCERQREDEGHSKKRPPPPPSSKVHPGDKNAIRELKEKKPLHRDRDLEDDHRSGFQRHHQGHHH